MHSNKKDMKYQELRTSLDAVDVIFKYITQLDQANNERELEEIFPNLLQSIGKYTMSDRSYIFEWISKSNEYMKMTYEWCQNGVRPAIDQMQKLSLREIPNWMLKFRKGEAIVSHDWDKDAKLMPEEYAVFDGQDIHSLIVIPIFSNKKFNGYIGLDNPEQSTSAMSLRLLSAVGGHIGSLKENLRMVSELEKKQIDLQNSLEELEKEKKVLDTLCIDYTSVYYCDLLKNIIYPIKQGELTNAFIIDQRLKDQKHCYTHRMKYYFEHFVVHESAPDFIARLSSTNLMRILKKQERFAYRFRTNPNLAGQQNFEVQVVRLNDNDGFKVVMGYRYIDDILQEQERQKIKLENALEEATLNNEIISSISKIYWLIYRMDLENGTYEEISAGQEMHYLTGKHGKTEEVFQDVRETIVSLEHQELMKEFLDTSTLAQRLKDTESIGVEYRAKNGSWHLARFIVKKRNVDGNVTNVLYLVREINKQKQMELEYQEKLLNIAEDAKRANMAKTDFLRRMSHDIRTPINGIRGMVEIAEHFPDDKQKQVECRNKVKEASGFLLDLVSSILDMNKLESGEVILEHKPFDLLQILQETDHITEMTGQENNILLNINHLNIQHRYLIGSPLHLRQILQNVAGNAVKYNRKGGRIDILCSENSQIDGQSRFTFICKDNGQGMSKEFLQHVFEPFAQENNKARSSYMGSGLGLAIVKQLVELMGGTIEIESELNVGTKVTIEIPFEINNEHVKEDKDVKEDAEYNLSGRKVLLVEDNELNMEISKFLLEKSGMVVKEAKNGREAIEIFFGSKEYSFDFILMDLMMPVMDGLEATRIIRSIKRDDAKEIPIFAMTANAFTEDIRLSKEAGMNEHLIKPLDEKVMLNTIKKYIK